MKYLGMNMHNKTRPIIFLWKKSKTILIHYFQVKKICNSMYQGINVIHILCVKSFDVYMYDL